MSLIDRIVQTIPAPLDPQFAAARAAGMKRQFEKQFRAEGLSRTAAKHAAAALFRSQEKSEQ